MLSTQTIPTRSQTIEEVIGYWDAPLPDAFKHLPGQHDQQLHNPHKGVASHSDRAYAEGKIIPIEDLACVKAIPPGADSHRSLDDNMQDAYLRSIQHQQGFDGLPTMATKAELDALIADGAIEMYRGCGSAPDDTPEAYVDELENGIDYTHPGKGTLGNGLYFAGQSLGSSYHYRVAEGYAGIAGYGKPVGQGIVRAVLRPGSKTIDYQRARIEMMKDNVANNREYGGDDDIDRRATFVTADIGRWAAANGYDAVVAHGTRNSTGIVLNRTALIIQSDPVTNPTLTAAKHLPGQHNQGTHDPTKGARSINTSETPIAQIGMVGAAQDKFDEFLKNTSGYMTGHLGGWINIPKERADAMMLEESKGKDFVTIPAIYDPVTRTVVTGFVSTHIELAISAEESSKATGDMEFSDAIPIKNQVISIYLNRSTHFYIEMSGIKSGENKVRFLFDTNYAGVVPGETMAPEEYTKRAWRNIDKARDKMGALGYPDSTRVMVADEEAEGGEVNTTLKHLPGMHDQKTHDPHKGGSKSLGADDLQSLSADELRAKGYVAVFRGVGPRGLGDIRPSESGQLGPGIYFYDSPVQARTYAGVGGGIITGFVPADKVRVLAIPGGLFSTPHKVVVLQDLSGFVRRGDIPTEDTLGDYKDLASRAEHALEQHRKTTSILKHLPGQHDQSTHNPHKNAQTTTTPVVGASLVDIAGVAHADAAEVLSDVLKSIIGGNAHIANNSPDVLSSSEVLRDRFIMLAAPSQKCWLDYARTGAELWVDEGAVPDLDYNQDLKGVQPRGWPGDHTWDDVSGVGGRGGMCVGSKGEGYSQTSLHELAHVLNYNVLEAETIGAESEAFAATHMKCVDRFASHKMKMKPYYAQPHGAGASELFASSMAIVWRARQIGMLDARVEAALENPDYDPAIDYAAKLIADRGW